MKKRNFLAKYRKGTKTNMATYRKEIMDIKGIDGCEQCGCHTWNGKPLTLEVHHVNGDRTDNRLCNLMILCPNCHTQTTNWSKRKGD